MSTLKVISLQHPSASNVAITLSANNSLSFDSSISLNKPGVRQTVISGPVTTAGLPNFLPATSASLSLTSQNISTGTSALVMTAAQGITLLGTQDVIGYYTTNLTWSGLTGSTTNYLYVNVSTGATGFTTLAPIYQIGGTPSTTNGQFTFNIAEMTGYLGNGTTAPITPIVFVGEAVTGASSVTSTVAYAYNGIYDSGATATLPSGGSAVSRNHNLGTDVAQISMILRCTTTDAGYAVGDSIFEAQGAGFTWSRWLARNTGGFIAVSGQSPTVLNKSAGTSTTLTLANWSYRLIVRRLF